MNKKEKKLKKPLRFNPSFMKQGDSPRYRSSSVDHFQKVFLAQLPVPKNHVTSNMANALPRRFDEETLWIPQILCNNKENAIVECLKTGGRTYIPSNTPTIVLNLADYGWAEQPLFQECVMELKGAGALFSDAGLSNRYAKYFSSLHGTPALCVTELSDRGRPKGAQKELIGKYTLATSKKMFSRDIPIKIAPVVTITKFPSEVVDTIASLSTFLSSTEERYDAGGFIQEVRLTPSTVRAIYFDKARTDSELRTLCSRVSENAGVLRHASNALFTDVRKYLEVLCLTTRKTGAGYSWTRVGDIRLAWKKEDDDDWNEAEVANYKYNHDFAWYLAKDITIAGTGAWFVDMESYFTGSKKDRSTLPNDLYKRQEIYVLCVLRDFTRVLTQFEIGRALFERKSLSYNQRSTIQDEVFERVIAECNKSNHIAVQRKHNNIVVNIGYEKTPSLELSTTISDRELAKRFY